MSTQKKSRPRKLECILETDRQFTLSSLEKELLEEKTDHELEKITCNTCNKGLVYIIRKKTVQ